jgi:glycerophosphoryl diester phosphodiesterase
VAVIAHRGASAYAPEHTNAAYTLAVDQGADYLEIDVQLTKDGQMVALHDPSLDRTARGPAENCTGFVSQKTVEDLYPCDVGTWFNEANPDLADPRFARQRLPLLTDVLGDYGDTTRYYIEVKAPDDQPGMVDALLAALDEEGPTQEDPDLPPVVIQSFSADALREIHERRPELPLVQLIRQGEPVPDGDALDGIAAYAVAIGPPKDTTTRELVDLAHERCLDVHPYTVDESAEMGTLLDADVGGIFTNAPDVLRDLLPEEPMDTGLCAAEATAGG